MTSALPWQILAMVLFFWGFRDWSRRDLEPRLRRLETKLDLLLQHHQLIEAEDVPAEVRGLLQAGRKIEAIQVYRRATGAGLAEAKESVDRIEAKLGLATDRPVID